MATLLWHPSLGVEMGHLARSFDSCLVCTAHVDDGKTGCDRAASRLGTGG